MQEGRDQPPVKELRLEGAGLFIVGGLFLAALAGSFYLGRWVERRTAPVSASGLAPRGTAEAKSEPPVDVGKQTSYFDTVSGGEKEAEPGREASKAPARAAVSESPQRPAPSVAPDPSSPVPPGDGGPFYVQLFAGRDQTSAESLVRGLGAAGYRVRMDTESSADGPL